MSAELTLTINFKSVVTGVTNEMQNGEVSIDVTGADSMGATQNVGITEEAIDLGPVTAGGYMIAKNLDATNYVSLRPATGETDMIRLNAGEVACFRLDAGATAPYAIADTSACNVWFILLDA